MLLEPPSFKALDAAQRSRARREANPLPTPAGATKTLVRFNKKDINQLIIFKKWNGVMMTSFVIIFLSIFLNKPIFKQRVWCELAIV